MNEQVRAETWMREALKEAHIAAAEDEVPVGAVVVCADTVLGRGHDRRVAFRDPTAHAEILALREAALRLGDWRLEDCEIFVTLEPCAMCAGAILLARIKALHFGAANPKFGAVGTRLNVLADHGWNHRVEVAGGLLAGECAQTLGDYFRAKRSDERG